MTQSVEQLEWSAGRYVLGEMDAEEAALFEDRLGGDEAAAGAVVAAVRLVEAIMAARSPLAADGVLLRSRAAERRRGGRRWSMVAVAACLAIAALPLVTGRRAVAISEPADIVWRWQGMPLEHAVGAGLQAPLESPAADRLPPWLVAAVAIAAEGAVQP